MSTGGAKEKQTTLNFTRPSQTDNHRNSQNTNASDIINANTGSDNNSNRSKRNRLEFEQPEVNERHHHLQVPDPRVNASDSNSSLFSTESIVTVIGGHETDSAIPIESASVDNISNATDERHKPRIIRLERMRDKADRYNSHISFLKECRDTKVIPKGLRIDVEPSIGNNDEDFCNLWFSRLEEFSITLISDIIAYSEGIENTTTTKINEETKFLEENMNAGEFKEIQEILETNATQRRKRLSSTKRKKYHFLRYNRPEKERPERQPSNRNVTRRQEQTRPRDEGTSRRDSNDRRRASEHHGNERNERRSDRIRFDDSNNEDRRDYGNEHRSHRSDTRSNPNRGYDDRTNDRDHASHSDRDDNNNFRDTGYGDNNRRQRQNNNDRRIDTRQQREEQTQPRKTTYRDILSSRRSRPNSRVSSYTNLHRPSNTALSRRNSNYNQQNEQTSDATKDSEIATLKKQLAEYERKATSTSAKNAISPSEEGATNSKKATTEEILDYLTTTMRSLEDFKRQLLN